MHQYIDLANKVLLYGVDREPWREGIGPSRELFGQMMKFNLDEGFPILTTKKVFFKGVVAELLWFLRGDTNIKWLRDNGVHIWDKDTFEYHQRLGLVPDGVTMEEYLSSSEENCKSGYIYGHQWRNFNNETDQIINLITGIINEPHSRRHIVTAWNPTDYENAWASLPACHVMFICDISNSGYMNMMVVQRSCDLFLGVPFNISSYALLVHILCLLTGYKPGILTWTGASVHIYHHHFEAIKKQLGNPVLKSPQVDLSLVKPKLLGGTLDEKLSRLEIEDFKLIGYESAGIIKAEQ